MSHLRPAAIGATVLWAQNTTDGRQPANVEAPAASQPASLFARLLACQSASQSVCLCVFLPACLSVWLPRRSIGWIDNNEQGFWESYLSRNSKGVSSKKAARQTDGLNTMMAHKIGRH